MLKKLILTNCYVAFSFFLLAQTGLQSPDNFLPHQLGEHFTPHYLVVDYFQHVAANSDLIKLEEYGRTNQKRPLLTAFISSKENLQNLEAIRQNNLRRTGLLEGEIDNSNPIAVVWLSFGVHGNEAGASESSMAALYDFVNPNNQEIQNWLKNTVVIIDPCVNPDGYSRYTHWNRNVGTIDSDPNPDAREHSEPWPGGRVNHYLFDLNRDWAWATQVETRQRLKVYHEWMPHIHADFHEQGHNDPYYFAPAAQPYHQHITAWQGDFQTEIGLNHTKYFDENGWLYFTREIFDLFYPSYGDTYPTFNGAIGMTYEQGGHSRAGRGILMENGDTLTLQDRIDHHRATALSTVEISSKNAQRLTQEFDKFFEDARNNPPSAYKTYIIKNTNSKEKIDPLLRLLDRHKIKYGSLGNARSVTAFDYETGKEGKHDISENDLVISAYQPQGVLTQVLFEPRSELVDSLTYDITAWALPYAYGLQAFATKEKINVDKNYNLTQHKSDNTSSKPYAYLAPWKGLQNARFLSALLQEGVKARYAAEGFEINNRRYAAGTLVITRADNRKNTQFDQTVSALTQEFGQEIISVESGFVTSGHDFGSESMVFIEKPNILVLSGERTFANEFGQVWYFFEQDLGYPITLVDADRLSRVDLHNYNLLILPEGSYRFNEDILSKLNNWISSGGRLIAVGYANRSLEDKKGFNLTKFAEKSDASKAEKASTEVALQSRKIPYKDRVRSSISNSIPGAIFKVKMDTSYPLSFGMNQNYWSLKTNSLRYDLMKNTWNVGYLEDELLISGFVGANLKNKLKNSVVFAVQHKGGGSITYLIDNPLYRSFWEEGKFLFCNALFFVGQ